MISKRKLKARLIDICNGAGMVWLEDDDYFDDQCLENVDRVISAIQRAFDLPSNSRLATPHRLHAFDDIDTLTDLVAEAIEYDKE